MIPASDDLQLLLHGDQDRAVVSLEGELGAISVPFVRDVVEQLLAPNGGADCVEIHIENLDQCDAAGLDLLTQLERAAKRIGKRLVIVRSAI